MKKSSSLPSAAISLAIAALIGAPSAFGASITWTGTTNGDFNTGTNWTGNAVPDSAIDNAQFNGANAAVPITGNITFTGTGGKITVGGTSGYTFGSSIGANTITLFNGTGDAIRHSNSATTTVNDNIILGDGALSTISLSSTDTAGGLLSVAGNITGGTGGTAGALTLSLGSTGSQNGNYAISGDISKGSTATTIKLTHRGTGIVTLTGTNTLDQINNNEAGGVIRINGGSTSITNGYGSANSWSGSAVANTLQISAGTFNANDARGIRHNLLIDGGTFNIGSSAVSGNSVRLSFDGSAAFQTNTFTMSGGALNFLPTYTSNNFGVRLGGDNGAGSGGSAFVGVQTGGVFTVNGNGGASQVFSLGSTTAGITTSYSLSGGTLDLKGTNSTNGRLDIGADNTAGTSTTSFNLSGTGKLLVRSTPGTGGISGSQATAAFAPVQVFSMTGGTLVAGNIVATNLRGSVGGTNGTFVNGGGVFAPGDIGSSGRTTITGNYSQTGGSLNIDLGGATAASAFQGAAAEYDNLSVVTGATTLGGLLSLKLTNGYVPLAATNHSIIVGTTAGATGAFTNQVTATGGNSRVITADGLNSFIIATNTSAATADVGGLTSVTARTTALGGYVAGNEYNAASSGLWGAPNAGSWTNFDPGSSTGASGAIAQFADGGLTGTGANAVTLNSTRNVQGIQFSSAMAGHNYSVSGSGAIILDNTANSASAIIAGTSASGNSNSISVPITLASNVAVSVTNSANTLTLGGVVSDGSTGKTLTKSGAGTLILSGANIYTGSTSITGGTFLANNSTGSATGTGPVILGAATLGGSGFISGLVSTGGASSIIAPGNSPGTLTLNGGLNASAGATFNFELGTSSDSLAGFGVFTGSTAAGGLAFNFFNAGGLAGGSPYTLISYSAASGLDVTDLVASTVPSGFVLDTSFGTGGFSIGGTSLQVQFTAVPEPNAPLLLAAGGVALWVFRRRRQMSRHA